MGRVGQCCRVMEGGCDIMEEINLVNKGSVKGVGLDVKRA